MKAGFILLALAVVVPPVFSSNDQNRYACEDDLIEIMFQQAAVIRLIDGEPTDLSGLGSTEGLSALLALTDDHSWERISDVSAERLDELEATGEERSGEDLYNLNNIVRLRFEGKMDIWELCEQLEALEGIMLAIPVPLPQPLPQPPDYQGMQGYLKSASFTPAGIDAIYAWTQGGGNGSTVTVCDLEYSWNYSHADLTKAPGSQINSYVSDPFSNNNHGTAVLGEMVSDYNGWGTTGICWGSGLATCGTFYGPSPSWNVAGALTVAIANLSAGDVILLEQQWEYVPGSQDYVPIEWWGSYSPGAQTYNGVYSAIQTAVANGIHVVEAGGNAVNGGGVNMDNISWFGDCGSMIVGAGGAYSGDRKRLYYSNYGTRFNCHGWGENVVTTGYGTLYSAMGANYYYASGFSGTSSASPMVAGAAACCVGYWIANGNPAAALTPSLLRSVLTSTGTPQIQPPSGNIGPRPNLTGAFAYLYSVGINEGEAAESGAAASLTASPNPSTGAITLTLSNPGEISGDALRIFDITGRIAGTVDIPTGARDWAVIVWDPTHSGSASSGTYFASGMTESGPITCRFVLVD